MKIIKKPIAVGELNKIAQQRFGNLIKAVVDVEKEIMALGGELHANEEALLLEKGSRQENLWGINLYPKLKGADFIEFDSMINLRPSVKNMTRGIDNPKIRKEIIKIVNKLVEK